MLNASHSQMNRAALSARVDEQHAALDRRVVGDDADRPAVDAAEADDELGGEQRLDLEERVVVDQPVDDLVHVERHGLSRSGTTSSVERRAPAAPAAYVGRLLAPARRAGRRSRAWPARWRPRRRRRELSPQPETVQCIRAPPISSSETFSPTTISAMRGRAEVHRGVALDHDHDVAERRDVGAAGGATARTGSRSAAPCPTARPGCGRSARRRGGRGTASTWSVIRAPAESIEPEDRQLLAQRRLGDPDDLLDRPRAPRAGLHRRVVGDDERRPAVDQAPPGDHAVGRQAGGRARWLAGRPRRSVPSSNEQRDPVAHVELVLRGQLGRRRSGGADASRRARRGTGVARRRRRRAVEARLESRSLRPAGRGRGR